MEELTGRLKGRATESEADFERRQRDAAIELARQHDYDYVVVNETGQPERTAHRIHDILQAEHAAHPDRRIAL
jgi:guanylate kinase